MSNISPATEDQAESGFVPVLRRGFGEPSRWTRLRRELDWIGIKRMQDDWWEIAGRLIGDESKSPRQVARIMAGLR